MPASTRVLALAVSAVLGVVGGVVSGQLLGGGPSAPDPLGLGVAMVNQTCTGQSLLVTATSASVGALGLAVAEDPHHTRYLEVTHSCATAWKPDGHAAHGYATYLGPFSSVSSACAQRMTVAHRGDLVTRLHDGNTLPVQCLCYLDPTTMPTLRPNMDASTLEGIYVRGVQKVLITLTLLPPDGDSGVYDQKTVEAVHTFQTENALPQQTSGTVDGSTWHSILAKACKSYPE